MCSLKVHLAQPTSNDGGPLAGRRGGFVNEELALQTQQGEARRSVSNDPHHEPPLLSRCPLASLPCFACACPPPSPPFQPCASPPPALRPHFPPPAHIVDVGHLPHGLAVCRGVALLQVKVDGAIQVQVACGMDTSVVGEAGCQDLPASTAAHEACYQRPLLWASATRASPPPRHPPRSTSFW